jgi:hypothetical protein
MFSSANSFNLPYPYLQNDLPVPAMATSPQTQGKTGHLSVDANLWSGGHSTVMVLYVLSLVPYSQIHLSTFLQATHFSLP